MTAKKQTLSTKIKALKKIKADMSTLAKKVEELRKKRATMDGEMIGLLEDQGLTMSGDGDQKVVITETDVPTTEDWGRFIMWARKSNNLHMIQRRVSSPAYREILALRKGKAVPGLKTFSRKSLSY